MLFRSVYCNRSCQTHRQDRLQYTAPLASAQCNYQETGRTGRGCPPADAIQASDDSILLEEVERAIGKLKEWEEPRDR